MDYYAVLAEIRRGVEHAIGGGRVADYIPALAKVDPSHFGIALATCDGAVAQAGEADMPFSIQSVSKVFVLTMALERVGDRLWERVGREPSGSPFNSIVQLEREQGVPRNPLINAGALVTTDALLDQGDPRACFEGVLAFLRRVSGDEAVTYDEEVARSEAETGFRNTSLANFVRAFGNMHSSIADVLDVYFHQCSITMSCRQLARAGLYLANAGVDPLTGETVTHEARVRRINALMMTCGHYDASGEFAFRVGLPGKSGVGGGILAVAPRRGAIAVWSPGLNAAGNSLVGALALEQFTTLTGWSVF
jgi:glutaminase